MARASSDLAGERQARSHRAGSDSERGLAAAAVAAVVVYAGVYNIGADVRHTKVVYWIITQLRDRSIAVRAQGISPPADLMSQARITAGAGLYASNCTGCHLLRTWTPRRSARVSIRTRRNSPASWITRQTRVLDDQAWRETDGHAGLGSHAQ